MKKHLLLSVLIVLFTSIFSAQAQTPVCGDVFMDPGQSSNYANNTDYTVTIYPTNPGDKVTVTFTSFNTEATYDGLYIFDGNSINAPQIASSNSGAGVPGGLAGAYWGSTSPGSFTSSSSDGSLTFRFRSDESNNLSGWVADVSCAPAPTCLKPSNIVLSNVSFGSATIGWTENNSATQWEILTQLSTIAAPTETQSGTICTTNPYTISGLMANKTYSVYVRSICSDTNKSAWSNYTNFSTAICSSITNLTTSNITTSDATFNWTSTGPATQWEVAIQPASITPYPAYGSGTVVTTNSFQTSGLSTNTYYKVFVRSVCDANNGSSWTTITFSTAAPTVPAPVCGGQFLDNGGADTNYVNNSNVTYTICPSLPGEVVNVTFSQFSTEETYDALYVYDGNTATATQISSTNDAGEVPGGVAGGFWGNSIPGPFTASNPSGCLTFVFISDAIQSSTGFVADVNCIPAQSCATPHSLNSTLINFDSITLTWEEAGTATQWEVLTQPQSAAAPTNSSTGVITTSKPYQITGLTDGTNYSIYIRAVCSDSNKSNWSNAYSFTTLTCSSPTNITSSSITQHQAYLSWTNLNSAVYEIILTTDATPPTNSTTGTILSTNYHTFTNLECNSLYHFYIRSLCTNNIKSDWTAATDFSTLSCFLSGNPVNLIQCIDNGQYCFDFSNNSSLTMGTLIAANYTITYYLSSSDAINQTNPIVNSTSFCTSSLQTIYLRLTNNTTQEYEIKTFTVNAPTTIATPINLNGMTLCDENSDGIVLYNLTNANSQINTTNSLYYYSSLANAINNTNAIPVPSSYPVPTSTPSIVIFIRETIVGQCDKIYSMPVLTYSNCEISHNCNQANSLCNSLGLPFANTHQGISNGAMNCLNTTPNPTWFYMPISSPGTISLTIEQSSNIYFGVGMLDVDYVVYGPFTNPTTPCLSSINNNNVVSCSYSTSAIETATITNAQVGQYYLLMTTNYSNVAGFIRISMNNNSSTGSIDCSGFRMNAFLDNNNNGTKETNEQYFPIGQFHYTINNGTAHNITTPSGVYNIYNPNISDSYNLSYTIDPAYSSVYNITTNSYNNVSVGSNFGMTTYNFPITSLQNFDDVAVSIVPLTVPRAGITYENKIIYSNLGNQTIPSGTITFNSDPITSIAQVNQIGAVSIPNGFSYPFSNLLPFETRTIKTTISVPQLPTVSIGQLLTNNVSITASANDLLASNNSSSSTQAIIAAYDPNDKTESHGGTIPISSFTSDDYLYFTIRFENTGSVSAIDVILNDILDAKLDQSTVKMLAASHPYTLDRINNNLTWKFNNIQLPVSIANTETGKGFVTFGVKPKAGYSVGDIIPNTAVIFFDSNPGIVTNTFNTEFVTTLSTSAFGSNGFMVYPNPATSSINISLPNNNDSISEVIIHDMLGKNIKEIKNIADVTTTVDVSNLAKGVYLVEIKTASGFKQSQKLIVR